MQPVLLLAERTSGINSGQLLSVRIATFLGTHTDDSSSETMSTAANGEDEPPAFQPFTKTERIQQLNDIDKVITFYLLFPLLHTKIVAEYNATPTICRPSH